MLRSRIILITATIIGTQWFAFVPEANAGLLRDWFNRCRCRRAAAAPDTCCAPSTNFAGLQPGQCQTTCMQTCSRVVVNYVPCTSFRTVCERVPVTTFRPETRTDPCTGCTITCMRPCTTFTTQTRRVPYTTFRPEYRTQTFQVPVTTVSNDCNTCPTASPCATGACGTATPTVFSAPTQTVPGGVITTDGTFGLQPSALPGTTVTPLPTPADVTPSINPQNSNRSVIDSMNEGSSTRMQSPQQNPGNWTLTAARNPINRDWSSIPVSSASVAGNSPVTRKWSYSPVKQASYTSLADTAESEVSDVRTIRGRFAPVIAKPKADDQQERQMNQGWQTVQW